jgi:hypothetical protein
VNELNRIDHNSTSRNKMEVQRREKAISKKKLERHSNSDKQRPQRQPYLFGTVLVAATQFDRALN